MRAVSLKCTSSTWGMFFEKIWLFLLKQNSTEKNCSSKSSLMLHFWCGFWVGQRLQFKWCWTGLATLTCSIVPKHNIGHLSCRCTLFRFNKKVSFFSKNIPQVLDVHFRETALTGKSLTKFRVHFHSPIMFKNGIESGTLTFFFSYYENENMVCI